MSTLSTPPRPWKAIPWGLVGMLCLVLLAEQAISRRAYYLLDISDWGFLRKSWSAEKEGRRYGVLCFGDSLASFGIVPRAITERSGRKAYNLAIPGAQAPASYYLLKRALDAGARPEGVVVDFFPTLLRFGPRHSLTRWASLVGPTEAAELAWSARDPGLFGIVTAGRLIPSVRSRAGLRDNLMAALGARADWRPEMNRVILRNWRSNDGAQLMLPTPGILGITDDGYQVYRKGFYPNLKCRSVNSVFVRKFLALAEAHGVRVYWVLPPIAPGLRALTASSGFDADHEAFLRSWLSRFPGLTIIDGRAAVSDPLGYFDPNHLSTRGAYVFSLALGDALRRTLPSVGDRPGPPASRWVALSTRPLGAVPDGVEDLEQSRLALLAEARAGRY